ncbi:MAG TPA: hydroxyisourate hydrolase [Edaphobacter sp.]|nr:hydroxyisourate hydrolase [Edaphobacter sp.]
MSGISTHVLDTAKGTPAAGIKVRLLRADAAIGSGVTGQDGRVQALLPEGVTLEPGCYTILFELGDYFPQGFYSEVSITFVVRDSTAHYHIPLLISPFGYTTYRGS